MPFFGHIVTLYRAKAAYSHLIECSVQPLVGLSVCLSLECIAAKQADQIWMRFGMAGLIGPGMRQVGSVHGRGNFVDECGVPHCDQWRVQCGLFPNYFG